MRRWTRPELTARPGMKRLAGLDSDPNALAQITLPPTTTTDDPDAHSQGERWTQLAVDLWEGDLGQVRASSHATSEVVRSES